MRISTSLILFAGLCTAAMPAFAGEGPTYKVEINKTEIVRLPGAAASIVVGNPRIADVTVQSVDTIFVVGRGFGETNLVILDVQGNIMMDADLQVVNSVPKHGTRLYNAKSRETYSCIPYCGPSPVLGDNPDFIAQNTTTSREIDANLAVGDSSVPLQAGSQDSGFAGGPGGQVSAPPF